MKIYTVEDYEDFPEDVKKAFGELDNGFEIEKALNRIGYEVKDEESSLCGTFDTFGKIENGNAIIARFMELGEQNKGGNSYLYENPYSGEYQEPEELCYDESWDWLMPVVKKIDSYANEIMTFAEYDDYRTSNWKMIDNPSKYNIEDVYKQIIQFLNWDKTHKRQMGKLEDDDLSRKMHANKDII